MSVSKNWDGGSHSSLRYHLVSGVEHVVNYWCAPYANRQRNRQACVRMYSTDVRTYIYTDGQTDRQKARKHTLDNAKKMLFDGSESSK